MVYIQSSSCVIERKSGAYGNIKRKNDIRTTTNKVQGLQEDKHI